METKIKESLKTFAFLLPDYFPEKIGNPNDVHRWIDVCYHSCMNGERLRLDDIEEVLASRFPDFDPQEISLAAKNYLEDFENYMLLLDYLKSQNRLK